MINVRLLEPGTRVALADGCTAEIASNPKDGIWVFARYVASPHDAALVGTEACRWLRLSSLPVARALCA